MIFKYFEVCVILLLCIFNTEVNCLVNIKSRLNAPSGIRNKINIRGGSSILNAYKATIPGAKIPSTKPSLPKFDMKYSIAGGIANAVSHSLVLPIDIVKTKQQVDPIKYQGNALSALNNIISSEGFSNILSSVLVAFAVYFMEGVVKHGLYENYKSVVYEFIPYGLSLLGLTYPISSAFSNAISSVLTATITSIVMLPWDTYRVSMLHQSTRHLSHIGNTSNINIEPYAFDTSFSDYGIGSNDTSETVISNIDRWGGGHTNIGTLIALLCKQIPNTLAKHTLFASIQDILKMLIKGYLPNSAMKQLINFKSDFMKSLLFDPVRFEWLVKISAAYFTSILTAIVSQPGDVLYSNMVLSKNDLMNECTTRIDEKIVKENEVESAKCDNSKNNQCNSIIKLHSIIKDIYSQHGIIGYFSGLFTRFLHSSIVVTLQLLIYDTLLK